MIWLGLFLLLMPLLSLPEFLEDKEQLTSRCHIILNPNANQTERENLRKGLSMEEAAYIIGYCAGLQMNEGTTNATNGTLPVI
jgi:hypothetical protein